MTTLMRRFLAGESGAVTVDYVVVCAAAVGLALSAAAAVGGGLAGAASDVAGAMDAGAEAAETYRTQGRPRAWVACTRDGRRWSNEACMEHGARPLSD
jgi:Flp pilus assembly pilin Flp